MLVSLSPIICRVNSNKFMVVPRVNTGRNIYRINSHIYVCYKRQPTSLAQNELANEKKFPGLIKRKYIFKAILLCIAFTGLFIFCSFIKTFIPLTGGEL